MNKNTGIHSAITNGTLVPPPQVRTTPLDGGGSPSAVTPPPKLLPKLLRCLGQGWWPSRLERAAASRPSFFSYSAGLPPRRGLFVPAEEGTGVPLVMALRMPVSSFIVAVEA